MIRAWSLLVIDEPQFQGNTGYKDDPELFYSYDETVQNSKQVKASDLAVVRDSDFVKTVSWIERIDETGGRKVRRRCPNCRKTGFKPRKEAQLRYRCGDCGTEFDQPTAEEIGVTFYRAWLADVWTPSPPLAVSDLKDLYVKGGNQFSIRELRLEGVRSLLESRYGERPHWWWTSEVRD